MANTFLFFVLSAVLCFVLVAHGDEPSRVIVHGKEVTLLKSTSRILRKIPDVKDKYSEHQVVVQLNDITTAKEASEVARQNGFRLVRALRVPTPQRYYLFERSATLRNTPHLLGEDERVHWWEDNTPQERIKRSLETKNWISPLDPLFPDQWHLTDIAHIAHVHINAKNAWKQGYTGIGVTIAIVDDGLEKKHPDLARNFDASLSWDFNEDDEDPSPRAGDSHGTSASGVAGANRDTTCGVGVAYDASVAGLRLLGNWESDATEAEALGHACATTMGIDIYSCSWGPTDDGEYLNGPGRMVAEIFEHCTKKGRDGKGVLYIWAGGNGRWNLDNSNYDGYANSIYTIAVGAINHDGAHAWYSEPGANLLCVSPSSGTRMHIVTTELRGRAGSSGSECTWDFGGTSASAPMGSGMVALVLQAKPALSWREVQDVIVKSSAKVRHVLNEPYEKNAAGYTHSHDVGFGMIDASRAVEIARDYSINMAFAGEQKHVTTGTLLSPVIYVESQHSLIIYWEPDNIQDATRAIEALEHVTVTVDLNVPGHSRCFGLQLLGPSGMNSTLSDAGVGMIERIQWTYMTTRHWGESLVYNPSTDVRNMNERKGAKEDNPARWSLVIKNFCMEQGTRSHRHHHHNNDDGGDGVQDDASDITIHSWKIDFYGH